MYFVQLKSAVSTGLHKIRGSTLDLYGLGDHSSMHGLSEEKQMRSS